MLDPKLDEFFSRLMEKRLTDAADSAEKRALFMTEWLAEAANLAEKGALKRALTSHPSKFTHPDLGASEANRKKNTYVTPVIFEGSRQKDGYVKTGNINGTSLDSTGSAQGVKSVGEVGTFLQLPLSDGKRFYQHLKEDTREAKKTLGLAGGDYNKLKSDLQSLLTLQDNTSQTTNSKVKQVYFPVGESYHLLSILTNSGILFKFKEKIRSLREKALTQRKNKNKGKKGEGFRELYDITTIGFGGAESQNISTLNNTNGGKAHLFRSMPPLIKQGQIFPRKDFFKECIHAKDDAIRPYFQKLHKLYKNQQNNREIRNKRDNELYQDIIDQIIGRLRNVRGVRDQYLASHSHLPASQKIWLQVEQVPDSEDWLDTIIDDITRFLFYGYEAVLGKKAIKLSDEELFHMKKIVEQNRERLR